jgi:hypothetical protein
VDVYLGDQEKTQNRDTEREEDMDDTPFDYSQCR